MTRLMFLVSLLGVAGCAGLQEAVQGGVAAATEPNPATGKTPVETITEEVPSLIANPGDLNAWVNVGVAVGGIVLGALGKSGYDKVKK